MAVPLLDLTLGSRRFKNKMEIYHASFVFKETESRFSDKSKRLNDVFLGIYGFKWG